MRRAIASVVSVALVAVPIGVASTAAADPPPLPTMTGDPLPAWQTDGIVWTVESVGNVVYVGGTFQNVRPPGAAPGTNQTPRANFAAFNATTGDLLPCAPSFSSGGTATIRALEASPDGSRLYAGGAFGTVAGTGVANLVSINTATCTLTPTAQFRRPSVAATVRAISASPGAVYFGGDFNTVDGVARQKFAAVTSAGTLRSSDTRFNFSVRAIVESESTGKIFVGGSFTTVDDVENRGLVAVDPVTADVVQSFPGWIPVNSVVKALAKDDVNFYLGAEGTGGGVFDGRAAGDLATGAMKWKDLCLGATQAVLPYQGVLYSGSHAHDCSQTPGGFVDGKRYHLLAQSTETMHLLPWYPNTNGGTGEALGPRAMVIGAGQLWVVGEFTAVDGTPQQGITRFAMSPDTRSVFAPTLSGSSYQAGKVRVSWRAGWDNDDDALTYELFRNGVLVNSQTVSSREWSRPYLSFVDTVTPGQAVSYRIRTSDGTNVSALGATLSLTAATTDVPYVGTVLGDGPSTYWPLDDTSGTNAADLSGYNVTGNYAGGPSLGQPKGIAVGSGSSVGFDGNDDRLNPGSATVATAGPNTFSTELWFRTTTTSGGKLIGFGGNRAGTSSNYDRHLYMNNDGNLLFGNYIGSTQVAKSPATYRDGEWHHAVSTSGPDGMRLYVDGALVASNPTTTAEPFNGWWKVGGDNLNGWPEQPSSQFFAGGIDEVAVYPSQLSASQVYAHYVAGRPSADTQAPTVPADVDASAAGDDVTLTWSASTDDVGVVAYDVHRSATAGFTPSPATLIASPSTTSFGDADRPMGAWHYRVVARDGAGNASAASTQASVTVSDVAPPSTPNGVSTSVAGEDVTVSWSASSDNVGVTGYDVHRGSSVGFVPSPANLVASTPSTTSVELDVPVGGWFYKVVARDAAGNTSPPSAAAAASVADTLPPSAPTGLTAVVGGSTVDLSWTASTDDVGVVAYDLHRSAVSGFVPSPATKVSEAASTSRSDSPGEGTWYYRVVARDAAGNASVPSDETSAVVTSAQPVVVTASPSADTYANQLAATSNFGTGASMASRGTNGYTAYLKFALPAAPAGKTLTGAVLRVRTTTDSFAGSVDAHEVKLSGNAWTETGLTWNNRPALGGTLGTLPAGSVANTSYLITLDAAQLQALLGGDATVAMTSSGTDNVWFWSRNSGTSTNRPELVLTYT